MGTTGKEKIREIVFLKRRGIFLDHPLISVIIPVYYMELYLERCLDSIIQNTYRSLEIICIDDGSADKSPEILRRYEANDSRFAKIFV